MIRPILFLDGPSRHFCDHRFRCQDTGQRIQSDKLRHVARTEVRVRLCHGQRCMPEHFLKRQDSQLAAHKHGPTPPPDNAGEFVRNATSARSLSEKLKPIIG